MRGISWIGRGINFQQLLHRGIVSNKMDLNHRVGWMVMGSNSMVPSPSSNGLSSHSVSFL